MPATSALRPPSMCLQHWGPGQLLFCAGVLQGLTPIRTRSWKDDNASFSDSDASAARQRSGPLHKALASAADAMRHLSDALVRPHCCASQHTHVEGAGVWPSFELPSSSRAWLRRAGYTGVLADAEGDCGRCVGGCKRARAARSAAGAHDRIPGPGHGLYCHCQLCPAGAPLTCMCSCCLTCCVQ